MCEIMNKLSEKAAREADRNRQIEVALTMIKKGKLGFEEIAEYSGLTVEEVKALAEGKPALSNNASARFAKKARRAVLQRCGIKAPA